MDIPSLAATAVRRQQGRSGRTFRGAETIRRELAAAGDPGGGPSPAADAPPSPAFNYPKGRLVKPAADRLLELLGGQPVALV